MLAFGDEWLPQSGPLADVAEFRRRVTTLRQRAADAGHGRIPVTVFGVPPRTGLLAEFAAAGADRCLLALAHLDASQTLATLDDWASAQATKRVGPLASR